MLKRKMYLERIRDFYNSDLIKILVWIRRCGKSVILEQIIQELRERNIDYYICKFWIYRIWTIIRL